MSDTLWHALAIVLVLEGVLPFAFPGIWRNTMTKVTQMGDMHIRVFGLVLLLGGVVLAVLAR